MESKSLGEVIKAFLKANKMSQEEFAVKVGVTARAIRWYMDGLRDPSGSVLTRICKVTNTDIRTLK